MPLSHLVTACRHMPTTKIDCMAGVVINPAFGSVVSSEQPKTCGIDPFGHFGPILQTFLFDTQPTTLITFTPTKPSTTLMYSKITHFSSPKGILKIADHNWKLTQKQQLYGHSYSAPTQTINTLKQFGLTITKAFAIHTRNVKHRFLDHCILTPEPNTTVPCFNRLTAIRVPVGSNNSCPVGFLL